MSAVERKAGPSEQRHLFPVQMKQHVPKHTTLRSTPGVEESRFIDVEFWLSEPSGANITAWVWYALKNATRCHKIVDEILEGL
jgi:hypothetical protein